MSYVCTRRLRFFFKIWKHCCFMFALIEAIIECKINDVMPGLSIQFVCFWSLSDTIKIFNIIIFLYTKKIFFRNNSSLYYMYFIGQVSGSHSTVTGTSREASSLVGLTTTAPRIHAIGSSVARHWPSRVVRLLYTCVQVLGRSRCE